jgi:hypothetical protein
MTMNKFSISREARGAASGRCWFAIGMALAVAACSSSEPPTHQTVEFYRVNKEARETKLAECENDPGALGKTPDCINAKQAARRDMKTLRDLPPLNLPGATPSTAPPGVDEQGSSIDQERSGNNQDN